MSLITQNIMVKSILLALVSVECQNNGKGDRTMSERITDDLNERQRMILKAVIDSHIESGEPIGSKLIAEQIPLTLSSATIRNVMSDLEKLGYLEQPHTSAGRVPSSKGYRLYVNSLMNGYALSNSEQSQIELTASKRLIGIDNLLKGAAETVSNITNYTALAVKPRHRSVLVLSFKLLPMNDYGVLMVMQTSVGIVKTRFVEVGFKVSEEMSLRLEEVLNKYLTGVSVEHVNAALVSDMEKALSVYAPLLIPIMRAFMEEVGTLNGGELRMEGMDKMLKYPEYSNLESLKGLLGLLEKKDYILNVVSGASNDDINIYIGPESDEERLKGTSLVFKTISENNIPVAAIGVIGPCRMDYPKVISTVEYLSDKISDAIKNEGHLK